MRVFGREPCSNLVGVLGLAELKAFEVMAEGPS